MYIGAKDISVFSQGLEEKAKSSGFGVRALADSVKARRARVEELVAGGMDPALAAIVAGATADMAPTAPPVEPEGWEKMANTPPSPMRQAFDELKGRSMRERRETQQAFRVGQGQFAPTAGQSPEELMQMVQQVFSTQQAQHKESIASRLPAAQALEASLSGLAPDDPARASAEGQLNLFDQLVQSTPVKPQHGYALKSDGRGIFHYGDQRVQLSGGVVTDAPGRSDHMLAKTGDSTVSFNNPAAVTDGAVKLRKHLKDRTLPQRVTF